MADRLDVQRLDRPPVAEPHLSLGGRQHQPALATAHIARHGVDAWRGEELLVCGDRARRTAAIDVVRRRACCGASHYTGARSPLQLTKPPQNCIR